MEKQKKFLTILNLSGEFPQELQDYFASRKILIVEATAVSGDEIWTHIVTKNVHNFDEINKTYKVTEKGIHVLSLTKVSDLQNFTLNNGNLILDESWLGGQMGPFIMDKFFQEFGGITLGENYPSFKETGAFNVINPFNTGEYLDVMVQRAFEVGVDALTLKTYFDHLIMYLAGLKKQGKAGYPLEVTYGSFEDVFALQIHFFCQELKVSDVTNSLSSVITKKAEEYFLNVAVQSADFFDFSYSPEVNKVIVTGLWTKDERIKFENRGLMFTSLKGSFEVQFDSANASSQLVKSIELNDLSDQIILPESKAEDLAKFNLGGLPSDVAAEIVPGSEETSDEVHLIRGEKELAELIQNIRGIYEDEKEMMRVSGGEKLDIDQIAIRIAASVDESTKDNNLHVRSLSAKLPEKIKTGLFDFAKGLGKEVEDLSDKEIDRFQIQKMPEIIQESLLAQLRAQALITATSKKYDNENVRALEAKLMASYNDNDKLRNQMKTMVTEIRILKESRTKLADIRLKAAQAANEMNFQPKEDPDEVLRRQFQIKLQEQKTLNEHDSQKLSTLLERESRLISDLKQEEIKARKLELESVKKDNIFTQEFEKTERQIKAKDLIMIKTKETFLKLVEKKDKEISDLRSKADQMQRALNSGSGAKDAQQMKELDKQNQNLIKQLEVYKAKMTSLASNIQASKADDGLKDELRKLQMMNQQMRNQLDSSRKEIEKLQAKSASDSNTIVFLKQEKAKVDTVLKKAAMEAKETAFAPPVNQGPSNDLELKRYQAQNQLLENQIVDMSQKIMTLEGKLNEAAKPQRSVGGDESSKVKQSQLENSVKKLTQDLVESRNQLAEGKKETNKLRQEKTALQNQIDKMKKEADKGKVSVPKKPGSKAA
jgi:hypothetical protein